MIPSPDQVNSERVRGNSASRGPGFTFHCARCKQRHSITGSKNINGARCCSGCASEAV